MQRKHLIAFTLATIFMLLGFNVINNYFDEKNKVAAIENSASQAVVSTENDTADSSVASPSLGEQPKATIDNITADIEQAEQQRLEQMNSAE